MPWGEGEVYAVVDVKEVGPVGVVIYVNKQTLKATQVAQ